jgi:hypothetical protein
MLDHDIKKSRREMEFSRLDIKFRWRDFWLFGCWQAGKAWGGLGPPAGLFFLIRKFGIAVLQMGWSGRAANNAL